MIEIYSIGDIKSDLLKTSRFFNSSDTLGGINSRHIKSVEEKFQRITLRPATFVSSCTNGIYLALKSLNLNGGSVIIPPITFFGLASAIIKAGGIPMYSRVDSNGLMDVGSVDELCDKFKVIAVIPSHINNRWVDVTKIQNVTVIEDAAPAFGMKTDNGDCVISSTKNTSVISFSYGKPLTTGEGGMVFGDDSVWMRGQRYCGLSNLDGRYGYGTFNVEDPELKLSNTGLNAALIMTKMRRFDEGLVRSRQIADYFNVSFGSLQDSVLNQNGNNQTFVILSERKNKLMRDLADEGIMSYSSHRPLYKNQAFSLFTGAKRFVQTSEEYFSKVLHIPCRADLTDQEVVFIAETVRKSLS